MRLATMRLYAFACSVALAAAVDTLVDVGYTQYLGSAMPAGITQWLGVRYAAPPLGELRFRAPADPPVNHTLQVADQHGLICIPTGSALNNSTTSEDCLFLDVYAPTNATSKSPLPVYVFIQGGGLNSNANPNQNGTGLIVASQMNIVVVTFNYRVGPYGFLASKQVQENGDTNVGLLDQRKVFEWVREHIVKFGGDPNHVTIGGDSAGGGSVDLHLSSYGGRDFGLFHAAAAESQSFGTQLTVPQAQYQYDALANRTGCSSQADSLECLRQLPIAELQAQNINIPFPGGVEMSPLYMYSNVVDGTFTQDYTYNMFAQGRFIRVPVIFGDDTNEGTIFTPQSTASYADMNEFLLANFPYLEGPQLVTIDNMYPEGPTYPNAGPYWPTAAAAYGEMRYICPGIFLSSTIADFGVSSWNYHYNVLDPASQASGYGVTHTVEINAIWGLQYVAGTPPASYYTTNAPIIPVMQGYWTSFIRAYNPNTFRAPGTPAWESWQPGGWQRIMIQTNATAMEQVPLDQRQRCKYLSSIAPGLQQ